MTVNENENILTEKYRPKTIDDIILPEEMKSQIRTWIKEDSVPNLLLVSRTPGTGKSSLAGVIINELNAEAKFLNLSLNSKIDVLREDIQRFVTTRGFTDTKKIIVLDEIDGVSGNSNIQLALRGFTEEYSKVARFILTANYQNKIIEPLQNRLQIFNFDEIFSQNKDLAKQIAQRVISILENEGIEYNKKDVIDLIKENYPSTRKILIKIQQNIIGNKLVFHKTQTTNLDTVLSSLLKKNFDLYRQSINNLSPEIVFDYLYQNIDKFPKPKIPAVTVLIAKYSYQNHFVTDKTVNLSALGAEIIMNL